MKPNTIVLETAYETATGEKATLSVTRNRSNGDIALNGEVLPDWRDPVRGLANNNQLWPEGSPSTPSQPNNAYTPALNGIVHDINEVVIPPGVFYPFDLAAIVDQRSAEDMDTLSTFSLLLEEVRTLDGGDTVVYPVFESPAGPHTVLAPTNEAFFKTFTLGELAYLSSELGLKDLSHILELHIIENRLLDAEGLVTAGSVLALNNRTVEVTPDPSSEDGFCASYPEGVQQPAACASRRDLDTINGTVV